METGNSARIPSRPMSQRADHVVRHFYRFDGLGNCVREEWDLTKEVRGSEFCWYDVTLTDKDQKLMAAKEILTKNLCPLLKDRDITTMVDDGPFCGHIDGALFIRVNSSGPALSKFGLRLAAKVTEKLVITVSSGPKLSLGFSPSDQSFRLYVPENPNLPRNDEAETSEIGNVERDTESLLTMNPKEADTPVPKTVGTLLVHIADWYMNQLQKTVTGLEIEVDNIVHGMKSGPICLEEPHTVNASGDGDEITLRDVRSLTTMHLDSNQLLQVIAHWDQVFLRMKEKWTPKAWLATEEIVYLEDRSKWLKENLGLIGSRIKTLQADFDRMLAHSDNKEAKKINRKLYYLSMLSVIVFPVSFITGIFGLSVGGMPWTGHKDGFRNVLLLCGVVAVVLLFPILYGRIEKGFRNVFCARPRPIRTLVTMAPNPGPARTLSRRFSAPTGPDELFRVATEAPRPGPDLAILTVEPEEVVNFRLNRPLHIVTAAPRPRPDLPLRVATAAPRPDQAIRTVEPEAPNLSPDRPGPDHS